MAHVVLSSFGSLGDLHPYLALGLGLQARGHRATIATSAIYRAKVEGLGLGFHPTRPHFDPDDARLAARVMDRFRGTAFVFKELVMPHVRETYADLMAAVAEADLLVSGSLAYVAAAVAETSGVRWASSALQPLVFFSAADPPVLPGMVGAEWVARLGPRTNRSVMRVGERLTLPWCAPLLALRRELGLPPGPHPLYAGQHAPELVLALFSPRFAPPQPDWPPQTEATGFAFFDEGAETGRAAALPEALERFLAAGEPPIVFTLGSSAVYAAGTFYAESVKAARALSRRAVLLTGRGLRQRLPGAPAEDVLVLEYAPYAALFPRAAATVHQGGIGTTAQALRAGRPMLVVPFAHDQPDNAARVARLGAGLGLPRGRYRARRVIPRLERLLHEPPFAARAAALGAAIRAEDGVARACEALERLLQPSWGMATY